MFQGEKLPVVVSVHGWASVPSHSITLSFLDPCEGRHGPCSRHGVCTNHEVHFCDCHEDPVRGYWTGAQCGACLPGFYGPACTEPCPGGACNPCSGHGYCDGGTEGTGACACWASPGEGHWVGHDCSGCAQGYYGAACALQCPGGSLPCHGHGRCADGLKGSGKCICDGNATHGFWAGPDCAECRTGHYGPWCVETCRAAGGELCAGHGTCDAGLRGSGQCVCVPGFVGPACTLPCPGGPLPCGGHGTCRAVAGLPQCACDAGWAGGVCGGCAVGFGGPGCHRQCPADCGGHGVCTEGETGTGDCECVPGWAGVQCGVQCPGGAQLVCNGRGTCLANGTCACTRSHVWGFWAGADCLRCAEGYAAPYCLHRCPTGDGGRVCSGRGQCLMGRCACDTGACGADCASSECTLLQCPDPTHYGPQCLQVCARGADGALCNGHGLCEAGRNGTGTCLCAGAWSGRACDVPCPGRCSGHGFCHAGTVGCICLPGFRGADCAAQCPGGWQRPCNAHGVCTAAAGCLCDAGYVGLACQWVCPGEAGQPCHGHGVCTTAGAANGSQCTCTGHWAGVTCGACAPGWHGINCSRLCHEGFTRGTVCVCHPHWSGPDCAVACPGGMSGPCGGHGVCNDTHRGDGMCSCSAGWRGSMCNTPCPGLLSTGMACGGHGECLLDATCRCAFTRAAGHWVGPACAACASGWLGPLCSRTCPTGIGSTKLCGGHGQCRPKTETCTCARDAQSGFWDEGSNCTECLPQYYGPSCQSACPSETCRVCSGHGTCDAGRTGTGTCACAPQWQGDACAQCVKGWHGPYCDARCPQGTDPGGTGFGLVCAGHGQCSDGVSGTGYCVCHSTMVHGFWAGAGCEECVAGYFGADCTRACPGPLGRPCHAPHGTCRDGPNGAGVCVCRPGYGGVSCALQCPTTTGTPCDGHGACNDWATGTMACDCTAAVYGHWAGVACSDCARGWVGPLCDVPCPTSSAGGVCSGHGECSLGNATTAVCTCEADYGGRVCGLVCPGGLRSACAGHGTCDSLTATCICFADPVRGYWAGTACLECAVGWSGVRCSAVCPRGPEGAVCSRGGVCYNGVCVCGPGLCGADCSATGTQCTALRCPEGRYGPHCSGVCPGGAGSRACAGRGICTAEVHGDGLCHCEQGYAGADCALVCPGGPTRMCSGHGVCGPEDGQCTCDPTYAGADCRTRCPVTPTGLCSGHGACNGTAAGDGTCTCTNGFGRHDCSRACPTLSNASRPCGAHGHCDARTAMCACATRWTGDACDACAPGWHGADCDAACVHGVTEGRVCLCHHGFAGSGCSRECPGSPGNRCSGHGHCRDGRAGDARCVCATEYYGLDCRTFCRPSLCFAAPGLLRPGDAPHAQCNAATGACECQDNRFGHWQGPFCSECKTGYWGQACELPCQCSKNGACGRLDGVCMCYADPDRGYWTGEYCTECQAGYLAPLCRVRNVVISRTDETIAPVLLPQGPHGAIVVDVEHALQYTGGQPLWVLPSAGGAHIATFDLPGPVHSGSVLPDGVVLLTQDPDTNALTLHKISRGPAPRLLRSARDPETGATQVLAVPPRFRPQAAAVNLFSAVYEADGVTYRATLSPDDGGTIVQLSPDFAVERALRLSPAALQLDTVRAGTVWERPGSEPVLLLSGTRGGVWGLVAVPLHALDRSVPLSDDLYVSACQGACDALAGVAVLDDLLLLVLQHANAIVLARARVPSLANRAAARVLQHTALDWLGTGVTVTALSVDPLLRAVFIAAHAPAEPSIVHKIRFDTLAVYGQHRFLSRAATQERIVHFGTDTARRELFALSSVSDHPVIARLLMYSVTAVEPPLVDARGRTHASPPFPLHHYPALSEADPLGGTAQQTLRRSYVPVSVLLPEALNGRRALKVRQTAVKGVH